MAHRTGRSERIDSLHPAFNKITPPVHIEQITANGEVHDATAGQRPASRVRDLEIGYTALGLAAPEKNRLKYKLKGYVSDWRDAGSRRQAYYTNSDPRRSRFRVQASNIDGLWNEAGASLEFLYRSRLLSDRGCSKRSALPLLWHRRGDCADTARTNIAAQFNRHPEERVAGAHAHRPRPAQHTAAELSGPADKARRHDYLIRSRSAEAEDVLDSVTGKAHAAIVGAREALHDRLSFASITDEFMQLAIVVTRNA